jgi:hypothetical protein
MTSGDPTERLQRNRILRIRDAANEDNGLAIQMSRYSNEDVQWLADRALAAEARIKAAAELCDEAEQIAYPPTAWTLDPADVLAALAVGDTQEAK